MRNALLLLLLLAIAAVPGSVYPQRSADPNGVRLFFDTNPELAQVLDALQLFDVYKSVWFSAIYILLFISLIGCVLPRTLVHWRAMRAQPVDTPKNLKRMPGYAALLPAQDPQLFENLTPEAVNRAAQALLKRRGFRTADNGGSVSSEKGYSRETGNLVFHYALIGVLFAVGVGGGLSYSGQRLLVEGDSFVNNLSSYDSFSPGTFFDPDWLEPFSMKLDKFEIDYDLQNLANRGQPIDFRANVTTQFGVGEAGGQPVSSVIRVNYPLDVPGASVYLTGNGFAPVITLRDGQGNIAFSGPVPFLPQDNNYTSLGVVKAPDAQPQQIGIVAFFYPTADQLESGAYTSIYPDPLIPLMTMNVYAGNLGLDAGIPRNVYALDISELELVAGRDGPAPAIVLEPGQSAELPNDLGSVSFDGLRRFASLDVAYNPGGVWVLLFAMLALVSVAASLTIARRRVWVRFDGEKIEIAALARGDDPRIQELVDEVSATLIQKLGAK